MSNLIAFCGLDCAQCESYQSTQAGDLAWQERLLAKWRVDFNSPDMNIQAITCDGCRGPRTGGYCAECPVRACAVERGYQTCADCPDYACTKLENFFSMAPTARATLELLRPRS